ncbi:transcriptional coactivator p15/PC4 family protein [Burkholderia cenocepacia]|uniref:transcriptional coactivator p15/PC4 family protein n=1 Tax=Burkholderia cenocepacia TaxID=95486 RepID=UPI002B25091B|nr:transcriptional coactivator p15/PC4 family protein [Burkholderia cenocepacia]MEB2544360.1 transcriptional coactivator p15/PC4 family protein [Burkholderia cenocepacia]
MTIPTTQHEKGRDSCQSATQTTRENDTPMPAAGGCFLDVHRSGSERLRVQFRQYRGREFLDVRCWYLANDGEYHPSQKGVTLNPSQLAELVQALMIAGRAFDAKGVN